MKKSTVALILLCCSFNVSVGQSITGKNQNQRTSVFFEGMVIDFVTYERISGAKVVVEGTKLEAYSNGKGEFEIKGLPPGVHTLLVSHSNHKPLRRTFELKQGGVYAGCTLKSGSPKDEPVILDDRPLGQIVIDKDAELIEKPKPVYPETARTDKVEGTVILMVSVNEQGEVTNAMVSEGVRDDLNRAARQAVQYFKFKPASVKGKPVRVQVAVPIDFKLALR